MGRSDSLRKTRRSTVKIDGKKSRPSGLEVVGSVTGKIDGHIDHSSPTSTSRAPLPGEDEATGHGPDSGKEDDGLPRLRTRRPSSVLAEFSGLGSSPTKKPADIGKKLAAPSGKVVNGAQTSLGSVWKHLAHGNKGMKSSLLKKDVHIYFQEAAWSLSNDIPLTRFQQSRRNLHETTKAFHEAMTAGRARPTIA